MTSAYSTGSYSLRQKHSCSMSIYDLPLLRPSESAYLRAPISTTTTISISSTAIHSHQECPSSLASSLASSFKQLDSHTYKSQFTPNLDYLSNLQVESTPSQATVYFPRNGSPLFQPPNHRDRNLYCLSSSPCLCLDNLDAGSYKVVILLLR